MALDNAHAPVTQQALRIGNAMRVLDVIRHRGPVSQARIAVETGLTFTTVHRLVQALVRDELVMDGPREDRRSMGRPPRLFTFNESAGFVVGIDVGNETTRSALAGLDGRPVATDSKRTVEIEADFAGAVGQIVADLVARAGVARSRLVSIGVGVPAVVTGGDLIVRAILHRRWEGLALASEIRRRTGSDAVVASDDYLATLGELRRGACVGLRNALVLNIGKGIGAGLIIEGALYGGASDAAGRVGWARIPGSAGLAPIAELLTADGIILDYRRLGGGEAVSSARDVFEHDGRGDPAAREAVDLFAVRLGNLISTATALLDPELIVVGGGIAGSLDRLRPIITRVLAETIPTPPSIVASPLGAEAGVVGAIEAAHARADEWLRGRMAS